MSAYPTALKQLRESAVEMESGHDPQRATNGKLHMRNLFTADKANFTVKHLLNAADKATLAAHYSGNRTGSFDFVWSGDGATYTVQYAAAPLYERKGLIYSMATVRLMEV